ncbi:MAG: hypothetical protein HZR80_19305 [Candidatus Heimdallarchaeota archaeon]
MEEQQLTEIRSRLETAISEVRKHFNANYVIMDYPIVPRPAQGKYIQADRNEAIKRIFEDAGFEQLKEKKDGFIIWDYNFEQKGIPEYPDWFKILKKGK